MINHNNIKDPFSINQLVIEVKYKKMNTMKLKDKKLIEQDLIQVKIIKINLIHSKIPL